VLEVAERLTVVLLRVTTITLKLGAVTVKRCSGGTCNFKTVTVEMSVIENGYCGGSLDRGGLANNPLLLAPNDMSGENGCITTVVKNAPMIGSGFRCGGEVSFAVIQKVSAGTLAL